MVELSQGLGNPSLWDFWVSIAGWLAGWLTDWLGWGGEGMTQLREGRYRVGGARFSRCDH
jgi:hypothetical protein